VFNTRSVISNPWSFSQLLNAPLSPLPGASQKMLKLTLLALAGACTQAAHLTPEAVSTGVGNR